MNPLEITRSKTANQREKEKSNKNLLDSTSSVNHNITIKKLSKNKLTNKLKSTTLSPTNKNISIKKNLNKNNANSRPISSKIVSYNMPIKNSKKELGHDNSQRHSLGLVQRKTIKYYSKFSIKNKADNSFMSKNANHNIPSLKILEKNIKNVINDIKVKIEKKNKLLKRQKTIAPNKFINTNLIVINNKNKKSSKEKKSQRRSLGMDEIPASQNMFDKIIVKKRNFSYDFNERSKAKLMKKIQKKIFKKYNRKLSIASDNCSDDSDNDDSSLGFYFDPNSRFIFIFDLLLIIANLYNFIFLPLNIARNKDIRNKEHILEEICYYLVDLIFFFDFLISFFRGYYNYEMKLIINNQQIIIHYLKSFFISDLLESIPIYSIVKILISKNYEGHWGEPDYRFDILKIFLFLKPFKTFKIIRKRQNKALKDFYNYFKDNFYLEQLIGFLIYILIAILFVHLFICLHIFLAYKSYPNWLSYTNNIDSVFFLKYITSLYFMITTMTTVGYGDIICISFIERIYHIFLLVIGTLLYTFIVSKIGNYLKDQSNEQIKLDEDLNILESIRISYPKMPYNLYSKIQSHLVSTSKKRKTSGISILINGVPETIKKDLLFKIYSKVIRGFTIFRQANNSNFIHQVLTSFIPIVSRKDEIIIMEGEFIENISFVKDGLLTLEISIDLKDPYKSIRNYIEKNFKGISKKEVAKNYNINYYKRRNSVLSIDVNNNNNYDDLKVKLDNMLLDKKNSLNSNLKNDSNVSSYDFDRMNFAREPIELNNERFQMIEIMDIRKNEYFGDIHMFLEQRSPFTIKTKTRIADILFLRKKDAIHISKNYPNICRRIQTKSFQNILSIKKKAFKMLRQYYDSYLFKKKRKSIRLNLNENKNSPGDNLKFLAEKSQDKSNINGVIPKNSFKKKNNLLSVNTKKSENKKKNENSLNKELDFANESHNSNSQFHFPNITINKVKKDSKNDIIKYQKYKSLIVNNNDSKKKKGHEIYALKNEIKKFKHSFSISKKSLNIHIKKTKYKSSLSNKKNIGEEEKEEGEKEENNDDEDKTRKGKMNINNIRKSIKEILSLNNKNGNLSKKIKTEIQKRKKIQKLIQYLNNQKYKINKNLVELYIRQNSIERKSSNKILIINKLKKINSKTSFKNKIISESLNPTNIEINSSILNQNIVKFNNKELNIIKVQSFGIKSSYKNINLLSKGKMINNVKYKLFVEKYIKNIKNEDISKINASLLPKKDKKLSMKVENFKFNEAEKKVIKNNKYYSEIGLPCVSQSKNNCERSNNLSQKNGYDNLKTTENMNSISELKSSKIKNTLKLFDNKNCDKLKLNNIGLYKKEENININNDNNVVNNIKIYSIGKTLFKSKKTNKSKKEKGKSPTMDNVLNKLDELNKDNNSKNENISLFVDKNHDVSDIKMINSKMTGKEKDDKCVIY